MAYQAGLPLLILKEKKIASEGILDGSNSEYKVFEFEIAGTTAPLPGEIQMAMKNWAGYIKTIKDDSKNSKSVHQNRL